MLQQDNTTRIKISNLNSQLSTVQYSGVILELNVHCDKRSSDTLNKIMSALEKNYK